MFCVLINKQITLISKMSKLVKLEYFLAYPPVDDRAGQRNRAMNATSIFDIMGQLYPIVISIAFKASHIIWCYASL